MQNPLGYWMKKIVFSWTVENAHAGQSCIQVYEKEKLLADTGWGSWDPLGTEVKIQLKPRTIYRWKVFVKTAEGTLLESDENIFETGKRDEKWEARWITCDPKEARLPVFVKEFPIPFDKKIESARLYICGLGLYEVYLNGRKTGEEYFAPGCNAYDRWLQAQTYDITEQLKKENKIAVIVGDGWYKGRYWSGNCNYGDSLKLIAEIHICYRDQTEETILTDESWQVERSSILFSGIYDGEQRDETLKKTLPEKTMPVKETMPVLEDRLSIPVWKQESFHPKILISPKGETILDIGQNIAGMFSLYVHEPYGTKVHLQFGEILQDGNFYRDNLRSAKAEYIYISDGKERTIRPFFTFYGYRYVKVEGISELKENDFEAFAIYSAISPMGYLKTGYEKVNQLISNASWGMKSNFVGNPTDCPQRDERMGWTGDAQVFCETASYFADTYLFYEKYLYDMMQEQKKYDGMVPDIVPSFYYKKGCAVWGDAICIIPWTLYMHYGDKTILEECYEGMKSWISYIRRIDGSDHGWRKIFQYGDWLALDCPYQGKSQAKGGTDEGFIADVYYRKSVLITAKTAKILGDFKTASEYEKLAEKILKEIRNEYFSPNGRCCIDTQTALLLTLKEELHDPVKAKEMLKTLLVYSQNKLTTGFVGTPILCEGLVQCGMEEEAFQILLNDEYPGWLYEVDQGATTIWERWNSLDEEGHISSTGMNSLNHYAYGSIVGWIWKDVAGIRNMEEAPGFRMVKIQPHIHWKLREVEAVYPSFAGEYKVYWHLLDIDHVHMKFRIPENCKAYIKLPLWDPKDVDLKNPLFEEMEDDQCVVQGGTYEVRYQTIRPVIIEKTIDELLKALMMDSDTRRVLKKELEQLDEIRMVGNDYPLRETLTNLGYGQDFIEKLNEKLISCKYGGRD